MSMVLTSPCWSCQLCRRLDGVYDPDTCPYEDRLCQEFRSWAAIAWRAAVLPLRSLKPAVEAPEARGKAPDKKAPDKKAPVKKKEPRKRNKMPQSNQRKPTSSRTDMAIKTHYERGESDATIERALDLERGTVYRWRKKRNLPSNRSKGLQASYWDIYLASNDELVAHGSTKEVIKQLRMTDVSFRAMVSKVRHGKQKKYIVLKDGRNIR